MKRTERRYELVVSVAVVAAFAAFWVIMVATSDSPRSREQYVQLAVNWGRGGGGDRRAGGQARPAGDAGFAVTFVALVGALAMLAVARSRRLRQPAPAPTITTAGVAGVAPCIAPPRTSW